MRKFHLKLDQPIRDVSVENLQVAEEPQPDEESTQEAASETTGKGHDTSFYAQGLEDRVVDLEQQLADRIQAIDDLQAQLASLQQTSNDLQTDRDSTRKQLEELASAEPEMDAERLALWQSRFDDLGQALNAVRSGTTQIDVDLHTRTQDTQNAVVEIACLVAEKIVREKIDQDEFSVKAFVDHIIQQISPVKPTEIALHPADLEVLRREADEASLADLNLKEDATLSRGDCRVMGHEIEVEATLSEHIDEIRRQLANTDLRK